MVPRRILRLQCRWAGAILLAVVLGCSRPQGGASSAGSAVSASPGGVSPGVRLGLAPGVFLRWTQLLPVVEEIDVGLAGVDDGPPPPRQRSYSPFARPDRRAQLIRMARAWAAHRWVTPDGVLEFAGQGPVIPGTTERRMIDAWLREVVAESDGNVRDGYGLVLAWSRGAAASVACDEVSVWLSGLVTAGSCEGSRERPPLDSAHLARLYRWFDELAPFQANMTEGIRADALVERLVFAGHGSHPANAAQTAEIRAFAASLLREEPAPTVAPASPTPAKPTAEAPLEATPPPG